MKEIYAFTLDDDIPLSNEVSSYLREIAVLLYDELNIFDKNILCTEDDNLIYNYLLETYSNETHSYVYKLLSDRANSDFRLYEPFVLNDRTFAITIYKDSVSMEEMQYYLNRIMNSLRLNYKFNIITEEYNGRSIKNRYDAIELLISKIDSKKVKKKVKMRTNSILSIFGI